MIATFHDVDQTTDQNEEWLQLRSGKLTSSSMAKVMANFGKAFGKPAQELAVNIAVEQITGERQSSGYTNTHMERGHEEEPLARMLYEQENFVEVTNGGFFDAGFTGCSPDGMVADDGLIEIKSVIPHVHYSSIKRQNVDPAYKWQCISNLKITERDWLDFVSYCSGFPEGKRLFVYRLHAINCRPEYDQIDARVAEFRLLVENSVKLIRESDYRV